MPFGSFAYSVRSRASRTVRLFGVAVLCLGVLLSAIGSPAQTPGAAGGMDEREQAFVEGLRRENPEEASRYVALRDARNQAIDDVRKAQTRYSAAGPELRRMFVQQLRDAQRIYAERSLALLDFLDARERRALSHYQEEINRINQVLEERGRSRAELEKLKRGE